MSQPTAPNALDALSIVRHLHVVYQTTYANAHNGTGKGIIESDGIAEQAEAKVLAEYLAQHALASEAAAQDYVAWGCYKHSGEKTWIVLCDSDTPGAFKLYRRTALASPSGQPVPQISEEIKGGDAQCAAQGVTDHLKSASALSSNRGTHPVEQHALYALKAEVRLLENADVLEALQKWMPKQSATVGLAMISQLTNALNEKLLAAPPAVKWAGEKK